MPALGPQPQQLSSLTLGQAPQGKALIRSFGPCQYRQFQAPLDGLYTFVLSGACGAGWINTNLGAASGGGGGGYAEIAVKMKKDQYTGWINIGRGGFRVGIRNGTVITVAPEDSSVAGLPDGAALSVTAGANASGVSSPGAGGTGTGGTLNYRGGNGGLAVDYQYENGAPQPYGNSGDPGGGPTPGAGGYASTNWSNHLVPGGGGGSAGTLLHPGADGGIGSYSSNGMRAWAGGGGLILNDNQYTPGFSIGGDARLSIFWLG